MDTNQIGKPTQLLIVRIVFGSISDVDTITDENSRWYGKPYSFQVNLEVEVHLMNIMHMILI
jgi:hypothetical protein